MSQLPTDRGHRYAGTSKMDYVSLIVHGMSGISVYSDVIFVGMLVATGGFLVFSVIAITAVVSIRLFTNGDARLDDDRGFRRLDHFTPDYGVDPHGTIGTLNRGSAAGKSSTARPS